MSIIPQCMNLGKIMVKTRTLDDGGDDVTQYLEETDDQMPQTTSSSPCLFAPIDWKKFFLITGKAGTGKSQIVLRAIEWALDNDLKVLVAKPTALLDIRYANGFDKKPLLPRQYTLSYPVHADIQPIINWSLSSYDSIFVDEASMITCPILQHVVYTIS